MHRPRLAMAVLALAVPASAALVPAAGAAPARPPAVKTGASAFGSILFDGAGKALYVFTADPRGRSVCTGACARAWPPYLVTTRPRAGTGARASLIGTTRRPRGALQATYAGRPLYYYVGDRRPGQVRCQNVFEFGGLWLVVRPGGKPVR
jgi:predicted lipoprotein with Yx(FWY)xxD motif